MQALRQRNHCLANTSRGVRRAPCWFQGAFTLIELLIVVVLMLVLTTLYWNQGGGSSRRAKACELNLQKIHLSLEIYANDFRGQYPSATNARTAGELLSVLVPRYTSDTAIFICPAGRDSSLPAGEPFKNRRISYAYFQGRHPGSVQEVLMSDRQIDTQPKGAGEQVFSENGKPPGSNHGKKGGNFLFCDGRVEFIPPRTPFSLMQTQGVILLNP